MGNTMDQMKMLNQLRKAQKDLKNEIVEVEAGAAQDLGRVARGGLQERAEQPLTALEPLAEATLDLAMGMHQASASGAG